MGYRKGLAGLFKTEQEWLSAIQALREAGFQHFEALSPYPVHGSEEAMGIPRSRIPYMTLLGGLLGLSFGLFFTWWTSAVNWPINIGGKPYFSLPAFVPVMFETTVLLAALFTVGSFLLANRLPVVDPPVIDARLTDDMFGIIVFEEDPQFNENQIREIFHKKGAYEIRWSEF